MNEKILSMKHISKTYPNGNEVLSDINLEIHKGDFITIVGNSGSGKSTLLNAIGLLDIATAGEFYFCEKNIIKARRHQLDSIRANDIGFIFQSYCLLDNISVEDNIMIPFLYQQEKIPRNISEKIEEYLQLFNLEKQRRQKAKYLSGGEKQRVAIIRALIKNPILLLADEPTGNLDYNNARIIYHAFKKITDDGTAVVVVTHSQNIFEGVDQTYQLNEGRLHRA